MGISSLLFLACIASSSEAADQETIRTDDQGHQAVVSTHLGEQQAARRHAAGAADWMALGPFGGDADAVAASTVDPNIVLAGIAPPIGGGALYRSTDAGGSWSLVPALNGISVFDVEFAPDGTAYIGTLDSVWKSIDGGVSWTQSDLGIGLNDQVFEVAIDPNNGSNLWIGIGDALGSQPVNVMCSTNAGATWLDVTPPMGSPLGCHGITLDPTNSFKVIAVFGGGFGGGAVWVSSNGGGSWVNRSAGLPANPMTAAVHDGGRVIISGGKLFGSQFVGVYASDNDGASWTALHDGSWPLLVIHDITLDPNNADVILAASAGAGAYRSTDGGASWEFGVGDSGSASLNSARFSPGSSSIIYLGASSIGVIKSTDGGDHFEQSSVGIGALNVFSIAANPNDISELAIAFQGQNNGGVFSSTDAGETWMLEPVPPTRYNTVRFAPDGTLYALSDGPTTVAPEGLYRREKDGEWTSLGPDQGPVFESRLVALRFSNNDPNLIMTGGNDFGVAGFEPTVWRSADGGDSWTKVYEGPDVNESVTAIEIVEDGTDMTMLATFTDFGQVQDGGAMRSTDGGLNWSTNVIGLPTEAQGGGLCVSPTDINTFYFADRDAGGGNGGVHKTTDAGLSWTNTGYTAALVIDVTCDPNDDQVLYIAHIGGSPGVFRSEDQGATFAPFDDGLETAGFLRDLTLADAATPRLLLASGTGSYGADLPGASCPTDLNGDGITNAADLAELLGNWGPNPGHPADFNGDNVINAADLAELLGNWGPCE